MGCSTRAIIVYGSFIKHGKPYLNNFCKDIYKVYLYMQQQTLTYSYCISYTITNVYNCWPGAAVIYSVVGLLLVITGYITSMNTGTVHHLYDSACLCTF